MTTLKTAHAGLDWLYTLEEASEEIDNLFKRWLFRLAVRHVIKVTQGFLSYAEACYEAE